MHREMSFYTLQKSHSKRNEQITLEKAEIQSWSSIQCCKCGLEWLTQVPIPQLQDSNSIILNNFI